MKYKIEPWAHQKAAIETARGRSEFALFFEVGTGKTATLIHILREIFNAKGKLLNTLILCPPIVIENWRREWLANSEIKPSQLSCLSGSAKKRADAVRTAGEPKIFITNYEALLMPDFVAALKFYGVDALVCDESHKLKDLKAKRTKVCVDLAAGTKYRYILTGTPILNNPMDIFSQFKILDQGKTFGKNYFLFRSDYFFDKNAFMPREKHFPDWRPKPMSLDKMNALIATKSMRVKKEECLDLPPLIKEIRYVELTAEQERAYSEMKKDFISFVQGRTCVATLALTKALRLMQIVSGFVKVTPEPGEGGEIIAFDTTPRLQALKELLEEITPNHKVIIWAVFKENYRVIGKLLDDMDLQHVEVHGEYNTGEKQQAVDFFTNNPGCRVLLANPQAAGVGVNLIAASYAIYYSRNFSLEHDLQSEARNYRGGSEVHAKITRIDLVAKGTIDELVTKRLAEKQAIGEKMIGEIAKEMNDE